MSRPKIAIFGLLPRQAKIIQSRFGQLAHLSFVTEARSVKVDVLVVMTRFAYHDIQEHFESVYGKKKVVLLRGGMTSLGRWLESFSKNRSFRRVVL